MRLNTAAACNGVPVAPMSPCLLNSKRPVPGIPEGSVFAGDDAPPSDKRANETKRLRRHSSIDQAGMDDIARFKLLSAWVIWLMALLGGIAPLLIGLRTHGGPTTSALNMFAAGVFLSGSCMHLLPDAQENDALARWTGCQAADDVDGPKCFQWANFFYGCGFLLVLFMEVLAHGLQRRYGQDTGCLDERTPLVVNSIKSSHDGHLHTDDRAALEESGQAHQTGHSRAQVQPEYGGIATAKPQEVCVDMEVTHAHIHGIMDAKPLLAFAVFIALSFHSLMEGIGIGASGHQAWDILVAVLAHKSLAAFALALELLHHGVPRQRFLLSIGIFSIMTPVGILLGWLMAGFSQAAGDSAASGICTAMAGGTFLFVAVMEIIPEELQNRKHLVVKCGALATGFVAMDMLSMWT